MILRQKLAAVPWFFFVTIAQAQAPKASLHKPTLEQRQALLRKVDPHQLPPSANIHTFSQQIFLLGTLGNEDLGLVPIYFDYTPTTVALSSQCGVFVVQSNGASSYLPIVGPDPAVFSSECEQIVALGSMPDPISRPRLVLLFRVEAPDRRRHIAPFILAWNSKRQTYEVDRSTSEWIAHQLNKVTVPAVRAALLQRGQGSRR